MLYTVKGLVLRETPVGDNAKYINVLTAERGRISVLVRGSVRLRTRHTAATQIFCYSEFVVYEKGDKYTLNESSLIESYFHLCDDFDKMTVATYVLNAVEYVSVEGQTSSEMLRLALNTLWALTHFADKPLRLIKGVFEMRLALIGGFAPNVVNCEECGHGVEEERMYLNVMEGSMRCKHCASLLNKATHIENDREVDDMRTAQIIIGLAPASVLAIQHALYAKMSKLFSFTLADELIPEFSSACEKYLENHVDHHFAVLDMLAW